MGSQSPLPALLQPLGSYICVDGPQRLGHFAFCPYRWSNSLSLELKKEPSVVFKVLRISLLSLQTEKHASQLCLESVL